MHAGNGESSQAGKCRAWCLFWPQDIAELEAAVAQNLMPLDALGPPHRLLRAFRSLLFLGTQALAAQPAVAAALPPSILVHHLYSRAPPALQSPHTRSGYTPAQARRPPMHDTQFCHDLSSWGIIPREGTLSTYACKAPTVMACIQPEP
jgi:hypothetical protein